VDASLACSYLALLQHHHPIQHELELVHQGPVLEEVDVVVQEQQLPVLPEKWQQIPYLLDRKSPYAQ